jgi:hypothetical protein
MLNKYKTKKTAAKVIKMPAVLKEVVDPNDAKQEVVLTPDKKDFNNSKTDDDSSSESSSDESDYEEVMLKDLRKDETKAFNTEVAEKEYLPEDVLKNKKTKKPIVQKTRKKSRTKVVNKYYINRENKEPQQSVQKPPKNIPVSTSYISLGNQGTLNSSILRNRIINF